MPSPAFVSVSGETFTSFSELPVFLHMEDFVGALIGPFDSITAAATHARTVFDLGGDAEVLAIYPADSIQLQRLRDSDAFGLSITPEEDLQNIRNLNAECEAKNGYDFAAARALRPSS